VWGRGTFTGEYAFGCRERVDAIRLPAATVAASWAFDLEHLKACCLQVFAQPSAPATSAL
jgi:hypothetical protein